MIHFVTALPCEAKPLARRFSLKPAGTNKPFQVYLGKRARLVVTKPGKRNASAAVSHLFEFSGGERNCAWLNVGAAGHGQFPVGQPLLASHIKDHATGRCWFLPGRFDLNLEFCKFPLSLAEQRERVGVRVEKVPNFKTCSLVYASVLTVDSVEKKYQSEWVYDMEAAGFFDRASECAAPELIQCFKVISDNPFSPIRNISAEFVESLVEKNLNLIEQAAEALQNGRI